MPKHINADDLLNRALADEIEFRDFDGIYETGVTIKDLMEITDKMPESIVRCKDCKYLVEIDDTSNLYVCDRIDIGMDGEPDFLSPENDFCSKGERKEAE